MTAPVYHLGPLTRRLRIWQRDGGHKASSDDVLLAYYGLVADQGATRCLDLGTGKATVAMLLSQLLPEATFLGVEAFDESYGLAVRNVAENGLGDRIELLHADLRDVSFEPRFDLVTGAPPFMPMGSGPMPQDAQRAAGRFELRGGVFDYARAAATALAPNGALVLLMDGAGRGRAVDALRAAGLSLRTRVEILPRPGRPATYHVVHATRSGPFEGTFELCMRGPVGEAWSEAFLGIRELLELP